MYFIDNFFHSWFLVGQWRVIILMEIFANPYVWNPVDRVYVNWQNIVYHKCVNASSCSHQLCESVSKGESRVEHSFFIFSNLF